MYLSDLPDEACATKGARVNNFFSHTKVVFLNELRLAIRNPVWVFFGIFQPMVYLLLFRPFLSGLVSNPGFGASSTLSFFVPGVLIMMSIFNTSFVGFPLIDKVRSGVIERWRVTPANRLSLVLGMVLKDVVTLLVQCTILFIVAFILGFRADSFGLLVTLLLLAFVGVMMASISYTLALTLRDEGALAGTTNFFLLPLFMLSGIMLPVTFAPKVIQNIAKFNPFAYAVNASRSLINSTNDTKSVIIAFLIFGILGIFALSMAIRAMKKATS